MERFNGTITFPRTLHPAFPKWANEIDTPVVVLVGPPEEWEQYKHDISDDHTLYVYTDKVKIGDGMAHIDSLPFADIFWNDNAYIHQKILEEMFTLNGTKSVVKNNTLVLKFI